MSMKFEILRSSWFAMGWAAGPAAPVEGAHFNKEENRWELEVGVATFLEGLQEICQKEEVSVKIYFPPYKHPENDLPIIELLDT